MENQDEIVICQTEGGLTRIEMRIGGEAVWLSQQQMTGLYQISRTNVVGHIKYVYEEGGLDEQSTCRNFRQVHQGGSKEITRDIPFYNLGIIISLGYRVKSSIITRSRHWATARLKEYMIKGFTTDDGRLKGDGGGNYWHGLLERIRDIRSSEKVLYRQVLDSYATSISYDPRSEDSIEFFKIVQNKLRFAAHGHTATEIIYKHADSGKLFMGLTTFSRELPALKDISIAKNYLNEEELKVLNNLTSGYFDLARINAIGHKPIYMKDYVDQLDAILLLGNRKLLAGYGEISHDQATKEAEAEYKRYQKNALSPMERSYTETIKDADGNTRKRVGKESGNRK